MKLVDTNHSVNGATSNGNRANWSKTILNIRIKSIDR